MPGKKPFMKIFFLIAVLVISAFTNNSCRSLNDNYLFVGTWQYVETLTADEVVYITTRNLQLTKTSYEETYVIQHQNSGTISGIIGTRGHLGKSRYHLTFELNELGTCARDSIDACTSEVVWNAEGTDYWKENIEFFGQIVKGDFKADETTLTLTRDLNNDGDTTDDGENVVFNKI
jgi:hypothetical protein